MEKLKNNTNLKSFLKWFFDSFIWLGILFLILDFVSKQIVLNLMNVGDSVTLIPGFLSIEYVVNDGMAFGLDFKSPLVSRIIFVSISIIGAIALILVYVKKINYFNKTIKLSLMLMTSGCIGNLIDRAFYSAKYLNYSTNGVVDWIAFDFGKYSFPRFNIADSVLVVGTFILIIYLFYSEFKDSLNKKETTQENKSSKEKIMSIEEKKRLDNELNSQKEILFNDNHLSKKESLDKKDINKNDNLIDNNEHDEKL